ncbi:putative metallopeptidase [Numidum massiliense]|uniref:putative metallopeptidase n=1 Tax=Numidum massiliense TaxID=1522315 RepID=UPI0006D55193|nr:putative metallopeptidase [Numidum massiliense]
MATTFKDAPEVKMLVDKLVYNCSEFKCLRHAQILTRFRYGTWNSRGKIKLGMAKVLTPFERFETDAECAVIVNGDIWGNLNVKQREALVYHELCHFEEMTDAMGNPKEDENKRPMYKTVGHDVEEFSAVVRKYGLWMADVRKFGQVVKEVEQLSMFEEGKVHKLEVTGS